MKANRNKNKFQKLSFQKAERIKKQKSYEKLAQNGKQQKQLTILDLFYFLLIFKRTFKINCPQIGDPANYAYVIVPGVL